MKYEVVRDFVDTQDNHLYRMGDSFPHADVDVSEERIAELASTKNRCGVVLIVSTEADDEKQVEDFEEVPKKKPKKKQQSKEK